MVYTLPLHKVKTVAGGGGGGGIQTLRKGGVQSQAKFLSALRASVQLLCTWVAVQVFSQISFFLELFLLELRIYLVSPTNQSLKPSDLKMVVLNF